MVEYEGGHRAAWFVADSPEPPPEAVVETLPARAGNRRERCKEGTVIESENPAERDDPFELSRFLSAQETVYGGALGEIKSGSKRSHWMWFVFPQIMGLGASATSRHYAIRGAGEARAYLAHPVLGTRLRECAAALLEVEGRSVAQIFGYPDDLKLKSSMTLFEAVAQECSLFSRVLEKYYNGQRDGTTLRLLERQG